LRPVMCGVVLLHGVCNSVYQIVQIQIHAGSVEHKKANLTATNEATRIVHERRRCAFPYSVLGSWRAPL